MIQYYKKMAPEDQTIFSSFMFTIEFEYDPAPQSYVKYALNRNKIWVLPDANKWWVRIDSRWTRHSCAQAFKVKGK